MDFIFDVLQNTRQKLSAIMDSLSVEELNRIPLGFNNNIIWNIGHILVSEQLLVYKLSGIEPCLSMDMINAYRKDSKPTSALSRGDINEIKNLLSSTIKKTKVDYTAGIFKSYNTYTVSTTGNTLTNVNEALQFAAIHEGLHYGYVLALVKALG